MIKRDSQFINVFSVVLAILIVISIILVAFARMIQRETGEPRRAADPILQRGVAERIRPFGQVAIAGQDNSALVIAAPPAATQQPAAVALPADGAATYAAVCAVCHAAGVGGAPRMGDQTAWAPRLAQGIETLHKHSLEGFQGQAGYMPAKGGRADLPDDLVRQAVDYMVDQAR